MQSALATKTAFNGNVHAFQARKASAGAPSRGQLQVCFQAEWDNARPIFAYIHIFKIITLS